MRSQLKADVPCVWNIEHEHAFNKVKEILFTTPGLRLFDPNMKVQIQCDASKTGIGVCLMQEGQPVAYYPKALTPTEMNWFPIEKECLAVVCAAEKFQHENPQLGHELTNVQPAKAESTMRYCGR